jgi:hypothetical protein
MEAKARIYVPQAFRSFQGFSVVDIKESVVTQEMEIVLVSNPERECSALEVLWLERDG